MNEIRRSEGNASKIRLPAASFLALGMPLLFFPPSFTPKALENMIVSKLQGPWVLRKMETNGNEGNAGGWSDNKNNDYVSVVIRSNLMRDVSVSFPPMTSLHETSEILIDASQAPAHFQQLTLRQDGELDRQIGIVRCNGDRLEMCYSIPARPSDKKIYPKDFVTSRNSHTRLVVYSRPNWYGWLRRLLNGILMPFSF